MTDATRVSGGTRNQDTFQVSADQRTILGNGTGENPLRVGLGAVTFVADGRQEGRSGKVRVGETVVATPAPPSIGIASVQAASAGESGSPQSALAQAIGIVVADEAGDACVIQFSGLATLAPEIWDSVTGQSGGLNQGTTYFLSNIFGELTDTEPTASGGFVVQVGIALSATTLLLSLPAVPRFIP